MQWTWGFWGILCVFVSSLKVKFQMEIYRGKTSLFSFHFHVYIWQMLLSKAMYKCHNSIFHSIFIAAQWNFSFCVDFAVMFHLMLGYMLPPPHSPPKEEYFPREESGRQLQDGSSVSGWNNSNSARANPSAVSSDFAEKSDPVAGISNNY